MAALYAFRYQLPRDKYNVWSLICQIMTDLTLQVLIDTNNDDDANPMSYDVYKKN